MRTITLKVFYLNEISPQRISYALEQVSSIVDCKPITLNQVIKAKIEFFITGELYSDEDYVYDTLSL